VSGFWGCNCRRIWFFPGEYSGKIAFAAARSRGVSLIGSAGWEIAGAVRKECMFDMLDSGLVSVFGQIHAHSVEAHFAIHPIHAPAISLRQPLELEDFPPVDAAQGRAGIAGAGRLDLDENQDASGVLHDKVYFAAAMPVIALEEPVARSEERRVGKEGR